MRHHLFLVFFVLLGNAHAQDPDQNPYFTRYTIVEDSDQLTPLAGTYVVHFIQRGTYWTYMDAMEPILGLPEKGMRIQPVFGAGYPALLATPARGIDKPDAQLVVLRGQDTMFVDLRSYYPGMGSLVNERCERMDCTRRPPVVLPFRKGRYHPDGVVLGYHMDRASDPRTDALTEQFDALWKKAMKEESVVPQLNSDTCRQELVLPPDVEPNRTPMRDSWLMRSPYCGTHLVLFPSMGTGTDYTITFVPYLPEQKKDPVHVHVPLGDHTEGLVDVSDWPVGDHQVRRSAEGREESFTLKFR
ncbi:MAG: hypothetical protein KA791_01890 [Flavobacteriales bacterium]|nr:hypothetical protein [Flavobacteriales bacterium]